MTYLTNTIDCDVSECPYIPLLDDILTNTIDCDVSECPYIPLLDDIFDEHNRL